MFPDNFFNTRCEGNNAFLLEAARMTLQSHASCMVSIEYQHHDMRDMLDCDVSLHCIHHHRGHLAGCRVNVPVMETMDQIRRTLRRYRYAQRHSFYFIEPYFSVLA